VPEIRTTEPARTKTTNWVTEAATQGATGEPGKDIATFVFVLGPANTECDPADLLTLSECHSRSLENWVKQTIPNAEIDGNDEIVKADEPVGCSLHDYESYGYQSINFNTHPEGGTHSSVRPICKVASDSISKYIVTTPSPTDPPTPSPSTDPTPSPTPRPPTLKPSTSNPTRSAFKVRVNGHTLVTSLQISYSFGGESGVKTLVFGDDHNDFFEDNQQGDEMQTVDLPLGASWGAAHIDHSFSTCTFDKNQGTFTASETITLTC